MIKTQHCVFPFRMVLVFLVLFFCSSLAGTVLAAPSAQTGDTKSVAKEPAEQGKYSKRGKKSCLICHGEGKRFPVHEVLMTPMGVSGDPATPMGEGNHDCETCHGPSNRHLKRQKNGSRPLPPITFDGNTPVETQNGVCLGCHNDRSRFHWPGSVHDVEGIACADCHDVHTANDPVLAIETQPGVCYNCHQEQRAQFLRQSPASGSGRWRCVVTCRFDGVHRLSSTPWFSWTRGTETQYHQ